MYSKYDTTTQCSHRHIETSLVEQEIPITDPRPRSKPAPKPAFANTPQRLSTELSQRQHALAPTHTHTHCPAQPPSQRHIRQLDVRQGNAGAHDGTHINRIPGSRLVTRTDHIPVAAVVTGRVTVCQVSDCTFSGERVMRTRCRTRRRSRSRCPGSGFRCLQTGWLRSRAWC